MKQNRTTKELMKEEEKVLDEIKKLSYSLRFHRIDIQLNKWGIKENGKQNQGNRQNI